MFLARFLTNVADFIVARSSDVVVVVCAVEVVKWRESLRSFVRSVGRSVFARSKSAYLLYYETRSSGSLSVHPRTLPANTTRSCNRKMAWEISGRVEPEIEMLHCVSGRDEAKVVFISGASDVIC